ncbi:preprotein translocase subunit SecE [Desulfobacter hydrogenophilus]|uniref:Protein translocase subunit SecE n=1 Tax=Desulfobacter hydrogenophilus TaxID=2291 RepID=A0A328FAS1_9BACT|nr:preprotein translocase subunit SecE [Desulfobacter hydrogenophilus]NDY72318.1 preprotein translocase subunit SecE [Desulfobacter hydrogenophilus]QBH13046.1 preprotein translocase subunit SecE [Desulfobacter hydrogenophilus]RAM01751.1 preprotein translocase subunit SecE [Desulfobacter hydrogenophilus]
MQPSSVSGPRLEKPVGQPGLGNFFTRTVEFFREVKVELKKVVWPTRKQTTGTTVVVIIFVFIVAVFLGVFDYSLSKLVQVVLT